MILKSEREAANTRVKLAELKTLYQNANKDKSTDEFVRELTLHSLKKYINQLTEELVVYEARRIPKSASKPIASAP